MELNDVDRRIWEEELSAFVPARVFDAHTHVYRWAFNLDPHKETGAYKSLLGEEYADATWELANRVDQALMPGREVHRLSFPFPFQHPCDFAASNAFIASETAKDPQSAALMLVHPGMTAEEIERDLDRHRYLGFKPYRFYSSTGDAVDCRLTDFMPEHQIAIAHRRKLIIMMHLAKRDAIADRDNQTDLVRLCEKYPNVRWILAHCARSYSSWAIEQAAATLRKLPNVWYDTSSVCESDAMDALYNGVGCDRVMYGSDDIPIGVLRGKYIAFGYAWAYLSEKNQSLNLSHCDARMTFTRYEQLRAMQRAARRLGMTPAQNQALFYDTAAALIDSTRKLAPVSQRPGRV
ncbi:MAG: amidohydrolase family protein [Planctomycetia bacterium]|nr:amidohydrolase family protein [Planctomycetia bacterium]